MPAGTNLEAIWDQNRCQDHFRCRTTLDDAHLCLKLGVLTWFQVILVLMGVVLLFVCFVIVFFLLLFLFFVIFFFFFFLGGGGRGSERISRRVGRTRRVGGLTMEREREWPDCQKTALTTLLSPQLTL